MKSRLLTIIIALLLPLCSWGITVKIDNPKINLQTTDQLGRDAIAAYCKKLTVTGIKGKDLDLVAIVQDDKGNWHKDTYGNVVKSHLTLHATYEASAWDNISVTIPYDNLSPKPGKHRYKVYLYVLYKNNWYGGTYVDAYDQTGISNTSSKSTSSQNHSHSKKTSSTSSNKKACQYCEGTGKEKCPTCHGKGERTIYRIGTTWPFTNTYEQVSCGYCNATGRRTCTSCNGSGKQVYSNNSYSGSYYNNNSNYYNNNSSGSSSDSKYQKSKCTICGGSGVCTSCRGKGGSWQDTGYYIGEDSKSWINCGSCNGSGKCFNCYGRGTL